MKNLLKRKIALIAVLVFLVSFIFRLYKINEIPSVINSDTADTLQTYLKFETDNKNHLFEFNWNGSPAVNTYIIGLSWDLFGRSPFGYRLPAIFFSSLAVTSSFLIFYFLSKNLFFSFIISLSLSANPVFFNFSREGWENIFNAFFINLLVIGFWLLFKKKRELYGTLFIAVGSILGFYSYHPGKIFLITSLIILSIYFILNKSFKPLALTILLFFLYVNPQIISIYKNNIKAFDRIKSVSILSRNSPAYEISKNFAKNIKAFIFLDSGSLQGVSYLNERYIPPNYSVVNKGLLLFYLTGIAIAIFNESYLFFIFLFTLFPVEIFSLDTPDISRGIHILPVMYSFICLGISEIHKLIKSRKIKKLYYLIISTIVLIVFVFDLKIYYQWIGSESTIKSREPFIRIKEFKSWSNMLENNLQNDQGGFNVGEWNSRLAR